MIEVLIWFVTFFSLFIGIFWLQVTFLKEPERKNYIFPSISIIVPCWNVGCGVWSSLCVHRFLQDEGEVIFSLPIYG